MTAVGLTLACAAKNGVLANITTKNIRQNSRATDGTNEVFEL